MTRHHDKDRNFGSSLLKIGPAAAYIGMSESWLKQNSHLISYVRIGTKSKRWRLQDLDAFIGDNVRGTQRASKRA
jgi:hypothetical protein